MPRGPPKEWFYYVVKELEKRPEVTDPRALAGWLWYHWAKPETKRAILKGEGKLDPLRVRKGLIKKPKVLKYRDYKAGGLIRILTRERDHFPEFALYAKRSLDAELKEAGFTMENKGKWVLRTNKFNIFVFEP